MPEAVSSQANRVDGEAVDQATDLVKAFDVDRDKRKSTAGALLKYYYADVEDDLQEQIGRIFENTDKTKVHLNLLRKFADTKAILWSEEPEITLSDGQEVWDALYREGDWSQKLRTANAWEKVLETFHIRVLPSAQGVIVDLVSPEITEVVRSEDDPTQPVAIMHQLATTDPKIAEVSAKDVWYAYWSETHHFTINGKGVVRLPDEENAPNGENPLGVLPFLKVDNEAPQTDRYWLPGARDVLMATRAVDLMAVALVHAELNQGFTQILAKNVDAATLKQKGPDAIWTATSQSEDPDPDIKAIQLSADLDSMVGAITSLVEYVVLLRNLPPEEFRTSAAPQSGFSKLVSRLPLLEERRRDIPKWQDRMRAFLDLVRTVWNASVDEVENDKLVRREIPENAEITVDFAEPDFPEDPREELERIKGMVDAGWMSQVDAYMHFNPDLTDEEAREKLLEIAMENRDFRGANLLSRLNLQVEDARIGPAREQSQ